MWVDSYSKHPRVIERPSRDDFKSVGTVCRGIPWRHIRPTGVVIVRYCLSGTTKLDNRIAGAQMSLIVGNRQFVRNSVSGMLAAMVRREHGLDKDVKQGWRSASEACQSSSLFMQSDDPGLSAMKESRLS